MSNPIIVICGPERSGKSLLINMLVQRSDTFHISGRNSSNLSGPFRFDGIDASVDYIYLDDLSKESLELIYDALQEDKLFINRKGKPSLEIKRPPIIITTNLFPQEFINLKDAVIYRVGFSKKFVDRQKSDFKRFVIEEKEVES